MKLHFVFFLNPKKCNRYNYLSYGENEKHEDNKDMKTKRKKVFNLKINPKPN